MTGPPATSVSAFRACSSVSQYSTGGRPPEDFATIRCKVQYRSSSFRCRFVGLGGDIGKRSAGVIRAGGTLVSVVGPPEARPDDGLAIDFVVESDRAQLRGIVQRVRDGRTPRLAEYPSGRVPGAEVLDVSAEKGRGVGRRRLQVTVSKPTGKLDAVPGTHPRAWGVWRRGPACESRGRMARSRALNPRVIPLPEAQSRHHLSTSCPTRGSRRTLSLRENSYD